MGKIWIPGGGGGADTDVVTASAGDVLLNKVIVGPDGEPLTGTMPNNGAVAPSALGAGGSYTIPEGYHNGSGKVTVQTLATMTSAGDATAAQILSGKKAYVDGSLLTGTLAIQSAISFSAAARSSTTIRISWKNPSKGPWTGVKIRMSTSGSPGVSGGTLKYTGTGSSTTPGGTSYVDISGLEVGTTYYFTCYSYVTGLGDSTTGYNVSAKTKGLLLYNAGTQYYTLTKPDNDANTIITLNSTNIRFTNKTRYGNFVLGIDTGNMSLSSYSKLCVSCSITASYYNYVVLRIGYKANSGDTSFTTPSATKDVGSKTDTLFEADISTISYTYGGLRVYFDCRETTTGGSTRTPEGYIYKIWLE